MEKTVEHASEDDTNCNWCSSYNHPRIGIATRGIGNMWASRDHPNYSIIEISQNTKKNFGDLKKLVTQTPVKNHRLTLV